VSKIPSLGQLIGLSRCLLDLQSKTNRLAYGPNTKKLSTNSLLPASNPVFYDSILLLNPISPGINLFDSVLIRSQFETIKETISTATLHPCEWRLTVKGDRNSL
jgi:hypothetical protein